ncbi:zinc-binding dehydrogenase [Nostoc sp. PCC 7107]
MNQAISHHQIFPIIDLVFPFTAVSEADRYLKTAAHFGKIVIEI